MGARARVLVGAMLAAISVALVPDAARADTDDERALAEKYAPVVMLVQQDEACGPGEPYLPVPVEGMFDNPQVALRGPWTDRDLIAVGPSAEDVADGLRGYALDLPGNPLQPGCDYEKWARETWKDATPTAYAHVVTQKGVTDRFALQFAFFYAFNDYNNKHETDWERIQLEFPASDPATALAEGVEPDLVVYSQHYGAERARWGAGKLEVRDGTHPVVYVSAGSHANQFSAGVFMGNSESTGFGCDSTAGEHEEVRPAVALIPSDPEEARRDFPWITYEGHYGEVGPKRFYSGPTGPNRKLAWKKPFAWSEGARTSSVRVPGTGGADAGVADTYCGLVGKGSDLFRSYVDAPGRALVLLALGLLLLLALVRRTDWATAPLPLSQARSSGRALAASARVLAARPLVFLAVAAPAVALNCLAAVLQTLTVTTSLPGWVGVLATAVGLAGLPVSGGAAALVLGHLDRHGLASSPDVRSAYATSLRRLLPGAPAFAVAFLVVVVLTSSLVLAPLAAFAIGAWSLMLPVVVLEERRGLAPLRRSLGLARHGGWTLAVTVLVGFALVTVAGAVLASLLFVVVPVPFVVLNAVPSLTLAVTWPLVAVLVCYAYHSAVARSGSRAADLVGK